jgi:hypothetical protein
MGATEQMRCPICGREIVEVQSLDESNIVYQLNYGCLNKHYSYSFSLSNWKVKELFGTGLKRSQLYYFKDNIPRDLRDERIKRAKLQWGQQNYKVQNNQ